MLYWMDSEFDEDGQTIELISIGIVAEDGRTLYAISNEFDPERPNDWVKKNVLPHLPPRSNRKWMSRERIKHKVLEFFQGDKRPEIWCEVGAYDWVVFAQLFGRMIDMPRKFGFFHMELAQWRKQLGNPDVPKQTNTEHDALADARYNKAIWEALKKHAEK